MIEQLKNRVFLAPMAGVTDRAYREIVDGFGAGLSFTEMVSAKGLYYKDKKTSSLLEVGDLKNPCSAQVFGHEPEIMAETAGRLTEYGAKFVDLNSGCPTPKVTSNGDGAALMKDPILFGKVVRSLVDNAGVPVSVKIRKGWDEQSINAVTLAKIAEENGASMITVHPRTARQLYSGKADWDIIKQVVENVKIPVVGNGDITCGKDANVMMEYTGCAAVMIGRGCMGNPWLIKEAICALEGRELAPPSLEDRISLALYHIRLIIKYKGEYVGIREARKHALWYIKGVRKSAKVKSLITNATSYAQMENLLTSLNES